MNAQVLETGVRHSANAGGGERTDPELDDVPVPHNGHDMLGDGFLFWFRLDGLFIDLWPFVISLRQPRPSNRCHRC